MNRRELLGSAPCAALGSMGITNTLLNLRMIQNATAATSDPNDYKALVCVFLFGGNDSYNMLVPTSANEYANYSSVRSNLAIPAPGSGADSLLPLSVTNTPGRNFGIHPSMPNMRDRFNEGNAAFVANVGTLVAPTTAAQVRNGSADLPRGLFGHNTQQRIWQTSIADTLSGQTGWGGRLADRVMDCNTSNNISMNISLAGNQLYLVGNDAFSYSIGRNGASVLTGLNSSNSRDMLRVQTARSLVEQQQRNLFINAFAEDKQAAYENSEVFSNGFNSATVNTNFSGGLAQNFRAIARSIAARSTFGHRRQIFFVGIGGYDTHTNLLSGQAGLLSSLDNSLNNFWSSLQELGVEDDVTLFTASDFGRTIRSNGAGSDHAWGGHSIVMGGAVDGQKIFGDYPDPSELAIDAGLDVGSNGRYVPTTSVDEYFAEMALWFGLPQNELTEVFPNLGRFYNTSGGSAPIGFLI